MSVMIRVHDIEGILAHRPILLDQHLLEVLRTSCGRLKSWTIQGEMHDITT